MSMQGYQFAHIEVHSVKGAPGAGPTGTAKRRNGQRAWTAAEILDEAERKRLASLHVAEGGPPPEIMAGEVDGFDAIRAAHAEIAAMKAPFPYTEKDGTVTERVRKLRVDSASVYTCLVSLPVLTVDALADETLKAKCKDVLEKAMAHERRRIEAAGGRMMMGVVHWDEPHVHAHFFALSPSRGRVDHLHPGRDAKTRFHHEHGDAAGDRNGVAEAGNRAYCDAMRAYQDDFHQCVFSPAGLLRFGPGRLRLSTAEYNKLKKGKAAMAVDAARSLELAAAVASQTSVLAQLMEKADGAAARMSRQIVEIESGRAEVRRRETEATALAAAGRDSIERGKALSVDAEAQKTAMSVGCEAVMTRQIDFREATEAKPEGLRFGPAAPAGKSARNALRTSIAPAYDFLVELARSIFRGRREEEREREALKLEADRLERDAADLRRRAAVVASDLAAAGRVIPVSLADIANGRQAALNADSFPGTWAIEHGTKIEVLSKRLAATTNLDLRAAHQATRDAALLCDGDEAVDSIAKCNGSSKPEPHVPAKLGQERPDR